MDILSHADRYAAAAPGGDGAVAAELARLRAYVDRLESERAALWWAIHHDDLTGLANRRLLNTVGPGMLRDARRYAVLVLDLNGFKPVNDRYGHAVGDEVLCTVGRRLSGCLVDDLAVRLGGDEFAAILTESSLVGASRDWPSLVRAISEALAEPMDIDGNRLAVTASIGVTTGGREPATVTELIRRADLAMYHAKSNRYCSYIAFDQR
ncbi:GGDEF domain-containing protein [Paractinoplanes globisporus]|uniref:GGDEF domain-containing protein n=1 Tax=Paractinoplanes globisporus TaxID=113565 RepID=A0ABW6WAR9_9ACTN|nr:GGDEF domain-containing protein [Actinoplanes globisporus]